MIARLHKIDIYKTYKHLTKLAMNAWKSPLHVKQQLRQKNHSDFTSNYKPSPMEIKLAHDIERENVIQCLYTKEKWAIHYYEDLRYLYNILKQRLEKMKLIIPSFEEFIDYTYENTERYLDLKTHKKARLLL